MKKILVMFFRAAMLLMLLARTGIAANAPGTVIEKWLSAQANVKTWSAEFTQTRYLKSLTQPLTATGHVWFAAPNLFRWELGDPAQTIAVRSTNQVLLIYPKLERVERYAIDEQQKGPWRQALALLEAGFPRSREDLDKQFEIVRQVSTEKGVELTLRPRSADARSLMHSITLTLDLDKNQLVATELTFADGSRMRNDFSNQKLNPQLPPDLFSPEIPAGYKVVEPLKGR